MLLMRYVTWNSINTLTIIVNAFLKTFVCFCLFLMCYLIHVLGKIFLVCRLLFTKNRCLQTDNMLWYYSWPWQCTKFWFLGIILFSILFWFLLSFLSFPYPSQPLFPYFGNIAWTKIQKKCFWERLNLGYAT